MMLPFLLMWYPFCRMTWSPQECKTRSDTHGFPKQSQSPERKFLQALLSSDQTLGGLPHGGVLELGYYIEATHCVCITSWLSAVVMCPGTHRHWRPIPCIHWFVFAEYPKTVLKPYEYAIVLTALPFC